ncbi:drug/metabolite transporter (DMT)-like permease [Hoeflea marina]|uniref:Drug/metabolite transporter (DMT)-like permease n=1 Tax=Hoeflea marina TaxID=274592 RepID=A0A317PRL6_9HYPH|nr:DMT family transporter [Hoeflea marina]PWW04123.1 drug/metabolite transporter (DMT)-like permease [Hoeflea marina]
MTDSPQLPLPEPLSRLLPWLVMLVTPLFFSSNLIFGRYAISEVAPFTLAFLRWGLSALVLLPVVISAGPRARAYVTGETSHWLLMGLLGMVVCGAGVYVALQYTTATNGTLIYTTAPLMILAIERLFYGRATSWRELVGIVLGFSGVAIIVMRGDPSALAGNAFNLGDLMFVGAALAWAVYSVLLRGPRTAGLPVLALFGLAAISGTLLLAPFAAWEYLTGARMPVTWSAWSGIAGIVVFASLLAFSGFQYGVARLGASTAGVFMYLLPPFGVGMAVLVLGEPFERHHAIGIATVLGGLVLATFRWPRRMRPV